VRYLTPTELLQAVSAVVQEAADVDTAPPATRGQLWAAVAILENLSPRTVEASDIAGNERRVLLKWLRSAETAGKSRQKAAPGRSADLHHLRKACRDVITRRSSRSYRWSYSDEAERLRLALLEIEDFERKYRRPTRFYQSFGA
jgi:hypothetical protein